MRFYYNSQTGVLADAFPNYETAIALIAMASAGDPQDADKLPKMAAYLERLQFSEDSEYNKTEEWYHGGWPNYAGIPDVSNSQFGLLGLIAYDLMSEGYIVPDNVMTNVTEFMMKCQNWPDVNDMPWAHNITLPSHRDGGFVYNAYRSRTPLGEDKFESYGSITGAGYYSYMAGGHDEREPEVAAARAWLEHEYTLDLNPRMIGKGLYYYLWTQTRALAMSGQDWLVDGAGKLHHWRSDVADLFMDLQMANGKWPGNPEVGWREEEPEIAGIYAILTLQAAYMTAPSPELTVQVDGAPSVSFVDLQGRQMVSDATSGLVVDGGTLSCTDPEVFRKLWAVVPDGGSGATITATGTWGGDKTSELTRDLGSGRSTVLVAASGFAGPFGIHLTVFDDAPSLQVDKKKVELVRGETKIIDFELTETSGKGPIQRAMLITHAGEGVVADVDVQGIDVPAGDVDVLRLTISIAENARTEGDWSLVITSSTAPSKVIPLKVVDSKDSEAAIGLWYWLVIVMLVVLVFFFLLLPQMAKRRVEPSEPAPEAEEVNGDEPVPPPDAERDDSEPG
jgi:hypothetical protein